MRNASDLVDAACAEIYRNFKLMKQTDIITRMEAMQQRFGRLQLRDTPHESEREILRCAPPFDAQAEHEKDLEYESRVDYESWMTDEEMGDE
jgi:hypothetical protein